MSFKRFLESDDVDEVTPEEIASDAQAANASMKVMDEPDNVGYVDPDVFYNKNGIFTFLYADGDIGLQIAWAKKAHRHMLYDMNIGRDKKMVTGRYGAIPLDEGVLPIVAFWNSPYQNLIKQALMSLWAKRLIHPESYMFMDGNSHGKVKDLISAGIPTRFKQDAQQKVDIGGKSYYLHELPAFLHTLPASSPEHQQIVGYICNNRDKSPLLKGLGYKIKCQGGVANYAPKMTLQQRYLLRSESNL